MMKEQDSFSDKVIEKISKRKISFFYRLVTVGVVYLLILLYFLTPFSKAECLQLDGTFFYSEKEILNIMGINDDTFLFNFDKKRSEELLNNHPLIAKSNIDVSPFSLKVDVEEIAVCYKDSSENIYLNDNKVLSDNLRENILVKDKLNSEILKIPYLLNSQKDYVLDLLIDLSLNICANMNKKIEYFDYSNEKDELNGDFCLYFLPNEAMKKKHFKNNDGVYCFRISASYVLDFKKKYDDSLKYFSKYLVKFYDDLLNDKYLLQNISKMEDIRILNKDLKVISFQMSTDNFKNLTAMKIEEKN